MSDAVRIVSVKGENYDTKTISFEWNRKCRPGQYVMVWIPGTDEIPMSLSSTDETKSITVKAIGDATRELQKLREGDDLHIRGPYGNGFRIPRKNTLIVAGGVGMAAVMPVIRRTGFDVVFGGRTSEDVIFEKEASSFSEVWISTDDGSRGYNGNAVQLARHKMSERRYTNVIACGPEVMLYHLHKACTEMDIKCQLSLERYMKCGVGVCGACMMNENRVCADGPVFTGDQVSGMDEFGRSKRTPSGTLIKL